MAGLAIIFPFHNTQQNEKMSHQGRQNVFPGHLRVVHADGIAGRTVDGSAEKTDGKSDLFPNSFLGILKRRFRHSHMNASHRPRQKPGLLEPSFILHLRSDSFFA